MAKYCYENKLSNQNLIAKPNIVWMVDCTSLDLKTFSKIYLFLYIYNYTKFIITYKASKKTIHSKQIRNKIEKNILRFFFYNKA